MKSSNIKRFIALFLTFLICFLCVTACGGNTGDSDTTESSTETTEPGAIEINYNELRLPYAKADTLDPFKCESAMNRQLLTLLYDSLFRVSNFYEAVPMIANGYRLDGTSLTVTINSGLVFSDNSPITADDIVYSFEQARECDAYSIRLENFAEASVVNGTTVMFTLAAADRFAAACLDFPIVRYGTVQEEYDALPDVVLPIGSGRYTVNKTSGVTLKVNHSRLGSFWPQISNIRLVNVSDSGALFYSLEIGNISFAFDDLSTGKYKRANANSTEYQLNNMVYIGINEENSCLGMSAVRRAINYAVSRTDIVETAFQGHAVASCTPFNPQWAESSSYDFFYKRDSERALKILENAGFDAINTYNIRNDGSKSLTFRLLVNSDNAFKVATAKLIAQNLGELNIHVSVNALPLDEYLEAYTLNEFDLYIGETNMSPNMSLLPFFGSKGALSTGVYSTRAAQAYTQFAAGKIDIVKYADTFTKDCPFIPICFRKGVVACVRSIEGYASAWAGDIYNNIEAWSFN